MPRGLAHAQSKIGPVVLVLGVVRVLLGVRRFR
jgi:hypothetical protein